MQLGFVEDARLAIAELPARYADHPALLRTLEELGLDRDDLVSEAGADPLVADLAPPDLANAGAESFDLGGLFGSQPGIESNPAESTDLGDQALTDIFRQFRSGVDEQIGKEDPETRYKLGLAYKEIGLIGEAIAEFQAAVKDKDRLLECASMLGLCFMEKGMPKLAVEWFEKGLRAEGRTEEEYQGLRYDLANAYEAAGDLHRAHDIFESLSRWPGRSEPKLTAHESGQLTRLTGLIVTVSKRFRTLEKRLAPRDRDNILSALEQANEAFQEGRFDRFDPCIRRLEKAARVLDRFSEGH